MYDDDDDDQRQALGQPSLDILMLKMIVNQEFLSLFFTFKTSFYRPLFFFFYSFVQYAVYDHVLSNYANIIWCL